MGGRGVPQKQTTVLISCVSVTVTRGEGVKNPKIWILHMYMPPLLCDCKERRGEELR